MTQRRFAHPAAWVLAALMLANAGRADTVASLLGNFTINQFCALEVSDPRVVVHYAVVFGQLPALRELHLADADGNGVTTQAERDAYVATRVAGFARALSLRLDGTPVPLHALRWTTSLPTEQGGFSLRVDIEFAADAPPLGNGTTHELEFDNANYPGSIGWHEIVVAPQPGLAVFDTNAYDSSLTGALTQALRTLPADGPLDERAVHARLTAAALPAGAVRIGPRPGSIATPTDAAQAAAERAPMPGSSAWIERKTQRLVALISSPRLDPTVALLALLAALVLGAVHALSPGHGKTLVGAYLVGSHGTPRHAVFLSLTVTITHTLGVFALGFATLYASRFVVPERVFPLLSLLSALLVFGMGIAMLLRRLGAARAAGIGPFAARTPVFRAVDRRAQAHGLLLSHAAMTPGMHSHGGGPMHSHLPPGGAGGPVTWRSLLALGVSGGLVPCPSALVLLLAAVALNKTFYGMVLVAAFSLGLALTLTAVGLAFLYARHRLGRGRGDARWPQLMPVASAAAITAVGACLCFAALQSFARP
jgi:ABC-type nickel/cobalt efflux system permease component RcnA